MDTKTLWLYLFYAAIAIIVIFCLLIFIASARVAGSNDIPIETEEIDIDSLKTGDILGVCYNHAFGWFVSSWFHSSWAHCSVIWKDESNGQIYVLEGGNYDKEFRNVVKMPISTWIKFNRNSHIGLARINKEIDSKKLIETFNLHAKYMKLDSFNYKWYRLLYKQDYFKQERDKFTCYEMLITILQDVEVVQKKYACSSYSPSNIMEGELDFCEGYYLEPPVCLDVSKYNNLRLSEDDNYNSNKRGCC
jgi:hypothetical protein